MHDITSAAPHNRSCETFRARGEHAFAGNKAKLGFPLGAEGTGEVVAVGEGVTTLQARASGGMKRELRRVRRRRGFWEGRGFAPMLPAWAQKKKLPAARLPLPRTPRAGPRPPPPCITNNF